MNQYDSSRNERIVHVVAGVITDAGGRILLARRTEGRDLAGLWEFPGGKVDPGETPEQALIRELREELAIEAELGEAVICVPQRYPNKRLRLDVRRIARWRGNMKGLDGQALVWVPPDRLARYAMPDADRPVVAALRDPDRYLITPEPQAEHDASDDAWIATLRVALERGVRRVQLRAPALQLSAQSNTNAAFRWRALVERAARYCRDADAEVFVNHEIDLARGLGIGVHLRASQLMALQERPLANTHKIIASCHTVEELLRAQALGCDAAVLGPVFETASHPGQAGIGWDAFATMREDVALPIYAIGGMRDAHLDAARAHGAQGIAAIHGLWGRRE
jgi:8-oxo-dGTP diphosphatase